MPRTYSWGIIGPGKIAHRFVNAARYVNGAKVHAVASRDKKRAQEFAGKHNIPVVHNNYEALAKDPSVDVIYIATPHSFHREQAIMCLENKKPVLCEKPLTVTYQSALKMVEAARKNDTFMMEALWTRFMPATLKVLELVKDGSIGEIKYMRGDFGDMFPVDYSSRVYDLKLGAGSILDIGIYPLFLALLLLGKPDEIKAFAHLAETGADDLANALLYYKNGCIASILSSTIVHTPITAEIMGTKGIIELPSMWYETQTVKLIRKGEATQTFDASYEGNGFEFQIQEVMDCLDRGEKESRLMSLDFTLLLSKTLDEICQQCGVKYP